ncbi:MAG: hypothetical protein NTZ33_10065 [Bacteroidetes bacterium]|nr:hypothetical protein [Bacteroidota bacterium]
MKTLIIFLLISFPIFCFSQTNWIKQVQLKTNKISHVTTKEISYSSKDLLIIDLDEDYISDDMNALFFKYDYIKDSMYFYSSSNTNSCYVAVGLSNKSKLKVKKVNEFKNIAGYKCQKGICLSKNSKEIIIWYTADIRLSEFFTNKKYDIEGVILEREDEKLINTTTEVNVLIKDPEILKVISLITPCNTDFPTNLK